MTGALARILYADRAHDAAHLAALTDVQTQGRASEAELSPRPDAIVVGLDAHPTCVMLRTGGTTGKPRGVRLSNCTSIETARNTAEFDHLTKAEDTAGVSSPGRASLSDDGKVIEDRRPHA